MEHICIRNFGLNKIIGSLIIATVCYIVFLKNIDSITKINSIIVPVLIVVILIIGIKNILNLDFTSIGTNTEIDNSFVWCIQAIIYASYNLILLIPVLVNLKQFIKSKKQIIFISVMTGITMNIISVLTFLLLANVNVNFYLLEMPIVHVIKNKFNKFRYVYGITILIAIFTTAVSVGISFLNNISKNKKSFPQLAAFLCITSVFVCSIGFSNLVKILFPFFGFLGLIQIYFLIKNKT